MCKRKQDTKRKRRAAAVAARTGNSAQVTSEVDPIDDRLNYVPPIPEAKLVVSGNPPVKAALIEPDEGLIIPTTGKACLKRVFLGLGWAATEGQRIDVDCCCAPFVGGLRVEEDTVWFGNLKSSVQDGYCTMKHSGDILSGQEGAKADLMDLERIYVDLENLPDNVDCLAFEANVFTAGLTFSDFEHAYIRLVNADTNQEIARCPLANGGAAKGEEGANKGATGCLKGRVLLFAKMYRGKERWVLHTVAEPRPDELRKLPAAQAVPEMAPPTPAAEAEAKAHLPPVAQVVEGREVEMARGEDGQLYDPVDKAEGGGAGGGGRGRGAPAKPGRSYLMPAVAVGTVAGIAAAVALFGPDPLDVASLGSDVFTSGVDFGALIPVDLPLDCGCCHDCECLGANVGDVCSGGCAQGGDLCACGPCFDLCGLESPFAVCCDAGGALGDLGGLCGGCLGGLGEAAACVGDGCGDLLDAGLGALGGCGDCAGGCGDLAGGCGDVVGGCGGAVGDLGSCCGEVVKGIAGLLDSL